MRESSELELAISNAYAKAMQAAGVTFCDNLHIEICTRLENELELPADPEGDFGWHEDVMAGCDRVMEAIVAAVENITKRPEGSK